MDGHSERCLPDWARKNEECPHGYVLHLGLSITVPPNSDWDFGAALACIYSLLPVVYGLLNVAAVAFRRRRREAFWLAFAVLTAVANVALKLLFSQPRPPASCLVSCGMPSGHSVFAVGMFCLLSWDCVLQNHDARTLARAEGAAALAFAFLPILWARVRLGDHSVAQVLVGSCVGALSALFWIVAVLPCLGSSLAAYMGRTAREQRRGLGRAAPRSSMTSPVIDESLLEAQEALQATEAEDTLKPISRAASLTMSLDREMRPVSDASASDNNRRGFPTGDI